MYGYLQNNISCIQILLDSDDDFTQIYDSIIKMTDTKECQIFLETK